MYSYYSSNPSYYSSSSSEVAGILALIGGIGIFIFILGLVAAILTIIGRWKVFKKANVGGWESLIPIHSDIVEMKLGGMHTGIWFLNLIVICGIGPIIVAFWKNIMLSKAFGKGAGFGVLLTFFPYICYPILGMGKAEYVGPVKQ